MSVEQRIKKIEKVTNITGEITGTPIVKVSPEERAYWKAKRLPIPILGGLSEGHKECANCARGLQ